MLTPEAARLVEQAQELALERKDGKLFSWKETQSPNRIIKRVENSIGIKAESHGLHGFRRAFANRLFEQKLEITDIQEIMRHRDIQTTLRYYKEFKQRELIKKMSEKL